MYCRCALILLCVLCAGCSAKPGSSHGLDGKPIYVVQANTREECLRAAEQNCQGGFAVLEETTAPRHRGGWVEPERRRPEIVHSMRVKCDNH
jgi:hypothetical protein